MTVPRLFFAYRDVGKEREQDAVSFESKALRDDVQGSTNAV
jgi:hypothetical protein